MVYRVVLISYIGDKITYEKTLHRAYTRETCFIHYHKLKEENKKILFPKKFINTGGIIPVRYEIAITKITEEGDTFRMRRTDYGKTYIEKPLGDWTIIDSAPYLKEEKFWIFGHDPKANRPNIIEVIKKLFFGAYKKNMVKQVIVIYNKLVIYNEDQFDMVICKCKEDAQRLHHTLAKKQKIKSLLFMGTAGPISIDRMYKIIQEQTKWPMTKIQRRTTRP